MRAIRKNFARVPTAIEAFEIFGRPARVEPARKEQAFIDSAERTQIGEGNDNIAVYAWGEGPVVALVHGWGGRAVSMCSFIEPLLQQGFRIVSFDGPGHGDSEGNTCNVLRMSRCIRTLADREGGFVAAIGHSFGAGGINVALGHGLDLSRVVHIAPLVNMVERFRQWSVAVGLTPEGFRELMARCDVSFGRGEVEAAAGDKIARLLDVPALVIHDPEDDEVPFAGAVRLVECWKGALLMEAPRLGHYRIVRSPVVVQSAVGFVTQTC